MVKQFKGQVKVEDVQKAFDDIVGATNKMINDYNSSSYIQDIDYSKGSPNLAANGYTLTVGGLKQFLKITDGFVLGAKPFRINDNQFKVTAGILSTKGGIYPLPDKVLDIPTDRKYRTVYYNLNTGDYQWTGSGMTTEEVVKEYPIKSDMQQNPKNDKEYQLGKATYDFNKSGSQPLDMGIYAYGSVLRADFRKYIEGANTKENFDNGIIKLDLTYYPHILANIQRGTKISLKYEPDTIHHTSFCFGTYNQLGDFKPQIYLGERQNYDALGRYFGFYWSTYIPDNFTTNSSSIMNTNTLLQEANTYMKYGDYVDNTEIEFGYNEVTKKDCIIINISIVRNGETEPELEKRYLDLPTNLDKLGINTILLKSGIPIYSTPEDYSYDWHNIDNVIITQPDGTVKKLNVNGDNIKVIEIIEVPSDTAAYKICDINPNAESKFISNINQVQVEKVEGKFEITSESKWSKPVAPLMPTNGGDVIGNKNHAQFIAGYDTCGHEDSASTTAQCSLLGKLISWNTYAGHRRLDYWTPINLLFLPKGAKNPFTFNPTFGGMIKTFKVLINKRLKNNA